MGLQPFRLLNDLPEHEEDRGKDDHGIVCDERVCGEVTWLEGRVAVNKHDSDLEEQRDPCAIWLEPAAVRESLAIKTLGLASLVESDVSAAHDDKVDQTSSSDDIDEIGQNLCRAFRQLQERQEGEDHDDEEAVNRNTVPGALAEELGGAAFDGERVQAASGAIGICVTSGEDTRNQESVDKMGKTADVEIPHGNDIGRGSSTALARFEDRHQLGVVVTENNANAECSEDEEGAKSPVDCLEGIFDVDTGALGLTSHHGDVLGTDNTEGSSPKSAEKAFKASKVAIAFGIHWARVAPVAKPICVFLGVTTDHGDEGEAVQDKDQDDLAA